ncbi:nucleotidyltransferase family protein [bacterium]|nr:nucleotidyltransferase family protein [bacterium]
MGRHKALLKINGNTFLQHIINNLLNASSGEIIVVLGSGAEEIKKQIDLENSKIVINRNYKNGQLSSLQTGLSFIAENTDALLMVLVDHPLVTAHTYSKIIECGIENPSKIILPKYNGKRGHPVLIPRKYFKQIMQAPLDEGLRHVIHDNKENLVDLDVDDKGITQNINTVEKYEECIGKWIDLIN